MHLNVFKRKLLATIYAGHYNAAIYAVINEGYGWNVFTAEKNILHRYYKSVIYDAKTGRRFVRISNDRFYNIVFLLSSIFAPSRNGGVYNWNGTPSTTS